MSDDVLPSTLQAIWQASQTKDVARELMHPVYRYPASMSPQVARSLIQAFTLPGDTILDPFCGGGTTAIEALAHGRKAICSDLNNLACFITRSKALPLSKSEISRLREWVDRIALPSLLSRKVMPKPLVTSNGEQYVPQTHALLLKLRDATEEMPSQKLRRMAKLIILRTGQLCFDCRQRPLNPSVLSSTFTRTANETIEKVEEYSKRCALAKAANTNGRRLRVFHADAESVPSILGSQIRSVSCILTSPPYPGVHVLYHRWQFRGRKEISLPYTLAGLKNGAFESHYTLGPRRERNCKTYFHRLRRIFTNLNKSLRPGTVVAQVVAFPFPEYQLPRFLYEMQLSGLEKMATTLLDGKKFIYRTIPNRKWYIRTGATESHMREYVLFHQTTGHVVRELKKEEQIYGSSREDQQ
ncbi:MAG: site-specific DNA-methyltransferase [Deltaproteobacteria bacterium]|nr:site-specific DNA-methyltransferase [Deltaproteobacteria bacterium]